MTSTKATSTDAAHRPPKDTCTEEFIFLLELFIRRIKSSEIIKYNECFYVPSAVAFGFLDFPRWKDEDLLVYSVDPLFKPKNNEPVEEEYFNSGKSVLFALPQEAVADVDLPFKIDFWFLKIMPQHIHGSLIVGAAELDMTTQFAALRKEMLDSIRFSDTDLTKNPSKTYDGPVELFTCDRPTGTMEVYARISAHGQTVVTEFDAPCPEEGFHFRADQECKPLSYDLSVVDESMDLDLLGAEASDCFLCVPPKLPCSPCGLGGGRLRPPPPNCPCTTGGRGEPECSPCTPLGVRFEEPKRCSAGACYGQFGKPNQLPIQTSRGPKEACGKPVMLKVSKPSGLNVITGVQPTQVTLTPESEANRPEDKVEHDVFILRIGKKGLVGAGEKSDIQLEMRTPKGPERKPPVRLESREIQTEIDKKGGKGGKKKK